MLARLERSLVKPSSFLSVLAGLALSGCIAQQQQQMRSRIIPEGFYLGAGAGLSDVDSSTGDDSNYDTDESDTSYFGTAGYRFHPHVAVETGYVFLGKQDYDSAAFNEVGDVERDGFHLSAIGYYPIGSIFEAMARVGAFRWEAKDEGTSGGSPYSSDDDGTDIYYGLGVQANITNNWGARLEWNRVSVDDDDVDNIALGVLYTI